jgi:copper resistance protein B
MKVPGACSAPTVRWLLIVLAMSGAAISGAALADDGAAPAPRMRYAQMAASMDMDDSSRVGQILVDQWELRGDGDQRAGVWELQGWYGDDYDKLGLRSEGEWPSAGAASGRVELLAERIISRWWSLQGGARCDVGAGPGKGWAALGVQGLAPYWIDVEATAYLGSAGGVAGRLKAQTDLRVTQRLIVQPALELNAYSRPDRPRQQVAGLAAIDAGMRLRYEIRRELAPYLGVAWARGAAATAPSRDLGDSTGGWQWLAGIRLRL